jgi:hypothetical protein
MVIWRERAEAEHTSLAVRLEHGPADHHDEIGEEPARLRRSVA